MENSVKGLHDCPCVLLGYDHFPNAQGNLFNKQLSTIAMMPEVTEMVMCPTFVRHMPDGSPLNSGHPRGNHVRYDLSHSTSPLSIFADY